eukprot:TRINITY_DN12036_c0_g1_i1.p1 TRINITY_DN12036_c0_g1~~TRINITY_DN12036_c0_g1_i1.p1  ORF type:complete len:113 (+),score=7.20 TRINITY_DN12036_c0_g1_i1:365-703(+)
MLPASNVAAKTTCSFTASIPISLTFDHPQLPKAVLSSIFPCGLRNRTEHTKRSLSSLLLHPHELQADGPSHRVSPRIAQEKRLFLETSSVWSLLLATTRPPMADTEQMGHQT